MQCESAINMQSKPKPNREIYTGKMCGKEEETKR